MAKPEELKNPEDNLQETAEQRAMSAALKRMAVNVEAQQPERPVAAEQEQEGVNPEVGKIESRKNTIQKLMGKFPRLAPLALSFITTTAEMAAPELVASGAIASELIGENKPMQKIEVEQKQPSQEIEFEQRRGDGSGWEKIDAAKVLEEFRRNVGKEHLSEKPAVFPEVPKKPIYENAWIESAMNGVGPFHEMANGTLPESAENIFINHRMIAGSADAAKGRNGKETYDTANLTKSSFSVIPSGEGFVVDGEKRRFEGVSDTRSGALQNALEYASVFLGGKRGGAQDSLHKEGEKGKDSSVEDYSLKQNETDDESFVRKYDVIKSEIGADSLGKPQHRVTVDVQGGQFMYGK